MLQKFEKDLANLHVSCEEEIENVKRDLQVEIDKIRITIEELKNDFCGVI